MTTEKTPAPAREEASLAQTEAQVSALWDILKRYDGYIATTNFKSGLLVTFNTALVGAILLQAQNLVAGVESDLALHAAEVVLVLIAICSVASLFCVIQTVRPQTAAAAGTSKDTAPSVIFFGSVRKHFDVKQYTRQMQCIEIETLRDDLSRQVWELAGIVESKFQWLQRATLLITWLSLPLMVALALLVIIF